MELRRCPCGIYPNELNVIDAGQGGKWAYVMGDCCGEWTIEFRLCYHELDSEEGLALATEDWNVASRGSS